MRNSVIAVFILFLLCCGGCGEKGTIKYAHARFEELVAEYKKKAEQEIEVYEPVRVNMVNYMGGPGSFRNKEELNQAKQLDYVQFSEQRWYYVFPEPDYSSRPFTVTATATLYDIFYEPIPREKYTNYEKRTGEYYNYTQDPIASRQQVKARDITFVYDETLGRWKEENSEVQFDAYDEE